MNVHLGEIIKEQRVAQGLRVQELAVFAQVSASYIYAVEAGVRGNHFDKIVRIAQVLKLDLYELASVGTEYVKS